MGNSQQLPESCSSPEHLPPRYRSRSSGTVLRGLRRPWGEKGGGGGRQRVLSQVPTKFGYSVEVLVRPRQSSLGSNNYWSFKAAIYEIQWVPGYLDGIKFNPLLVG